MSTGAQRCLHRVGYDARVASVGMVESKRGGTSYMYEEELVARGIWGHPSRTLPCLKGRGNSSKSWHAASNPTTMEQRDTTSDRAGVKVQSRRRSNGSGTCSHMKLSGFES
jgi:hypothetical protein